ncbi:MAG: hypothetical protein M1812_004060 [Candelaria pacifica]|nr:MAG: hypothetical protein M1812_004060 [Candelaria pacifica]
MAKIPPSTWQLPPTPPTSPHPMEISTPHQPFSMVPAQKHWTPSIVSPYASPLGQHSATSTTRFNLQRSRTTKPATACSLRALYKMKQAGDGPSSSPSIVAPRPLRVRSALSSSPFPLGPPSPLLSLSSPAPSAPSPYKPDHIERNSQDDPTIPPITVPRSPQHHEHGFPEPSTLSQRLLTPSLISELLPLFPKLLSRQGWDKPTAQLCYGWALKNPRIALLLYMTDNSCCWPIAAIFNPLKDSFLPFSEVDLASVVSNSMAVMDAQWRVTVGALPPLGAHIEMRPNECLPLTVSNPARLHDRKTPDGIEKVRWKSVGSEVYARKCIRYSRSQSKAEVLGQIESFGNLRHKSIIKLRCTYAVDDLLYMMMPLSESNLEAFLGSPSNDGRADRMRNWLVDLMNALEYLHSFNIRHCSIRPTKILITGDRILFGAFGIGEASEVSYSPHDESVMYAAPEVITRDKFFRASDVFALGCVFLEMMTVIKRHTVEAFRSFRSCANSASFQGNLDKVMAWIQLLEARAGFGLRDEFMSDGMALTLISWMVDEEHAKRPKAKVLAASFNEWSFGRSAGGWSTIEENIAQ